MKPKTLNHFLRSLLILGILSLGGYLFVLVMFEILRPRMVAYEDVSRFEPWMNLVGISWLLGLAFHGLSLITLMFFLKLIRNRYAVYSLLLLLGVLSTLMLLANVPLISDIGKQHQQGLDQPEWTFLYLNHLLHLVYTGALLIALFGWIKGRSGELSTASPACDDAIFVVAQYTGVLCGLLGLVSVVGYFYWEVPLWIIKRAGMVFSIILLAPYACIAGFWMMMKRKEKISHWYDEKQLQDVTRSGFLTLLISLPALGLWYLIQVNVSTQLLSIMWFPVYAFGVLLLFSGTTLFFYRYR